MYVFSIHCALQARIKAKPLVRSATHFPPNKNMSRPQQETPMPNYMRQQQPQYPPVMPTHMTPQFPQQQVPQAVPVRLAT